jgi:flagellar biosynthesis protein FlhA
MPDALTLAERARGAARSLAVAGFGAGPQLTAVAVAAAAVLALLLPAPPLLVDLVLALSLGAAAGLLVVVLATPDPLSLTSMPPLLVLSSLTRVVLCLCVSRMILVAGEAGTLVPTLGLASSGGDVVAGIGVLVVIAVVQVVMVTAGVGRLAEVAARFALDALPGKQMGLDTAVSSGQLGAREAQGEVRRLEREANIYGAMDGAGRLLRGEAVATIVIVALTALGGAGRAATGGGGLLEALGEYTVLATGQGLVTLLPALVMAASAALIVSRSAGSMPLVEEMRGQLLLSPWPLVAAAVALTGIGLFPGVAKLPTLIGAAILAGGGWWVARLPATAPNAVASGDPALSRSGGELAIEVGMGLLEVIGGSDGLVAMLPSLRAGVSRELGFEVPSIVVRDSLELGATEYTLVYRAGVLARGRVRPARMLAVAPQAGATPDIGAAAELPDGRSGVWVTPEQAEELAALGFLLMTPAEALVAHLRSALRHHATALFDLERAAALLAELRPGHAALLDAAGAAGLDAGLLRRVCGELLWAGVPLRDPVSLLEAVVEALPETRDPEQLALRARPRLAAMVTDVLTVDGRIRAVTLAPELQEELADAAWREEGRTVAAMPPPRAAAWVALLDQLCAEHGWGRPLAVIAEPRSVLALQSLCRRATGELTALRVSDLTPEAPVEQVARIEPEQLA